MRQLGGRCVWPEGCSETRYEFLSFDHKIPDDTDFGRLARWQRIARYEREAAEGKIQLLCLFHNRVKGVHTLEELFDEVPF